MCSFTACGNLKYDMAYEADSAVSSFNVISGRESKTAQPFAADLCVITGDILDDENVDMSQATAAVLVDLNSKEAVYSKFNHTDDAKMTLEIAVNHIPFTADFPEVDPEGNEATIQFTSDAAIIKTASESPVTITLINKTASYTA